MRSTIRYSCAIYLVSLTAQLFAQSAVVPAPVREPQAELVLQQSLTTNSSVQEVRDSVVRGTLIRHGGGPPHEAHVTIKSRGRSKRVDVDGTSRTHVTARGKSSARDEHGWHGFHDPNSANRHIEHLPSGLITELLKRSDISLHYVGQEILNGRSVHHLRAHTVHHLGPLGDPEIVNRLNKNSELDLYLDVESHLLTRLTFTQISMTDWRRGLLVTIDYEDYREFHGSKIPARQRKSLAGQLISELLIMSATLNSGLQASEFEVQQ